MIPGSTAEYVLQESRDVFITNSEWQLANIQISPVILSLGSHSYSQVKYFACVYAQTSASKTKSKTECWGSPDYRALRCD